MPLGALPPQLALRRQQVAQPKQQRQPLRVLHQPSVADFPVAEQTLNPQEGMLHLALADALAFSACAASLPGSNSRRWPGRIATNHRTSDSRFSSRLPAP